MTNISIFNSTNPSGGDSKPTTKTKAKVKDWVTELFRSKGYRTWIMEENPAVIDGTPYHLDIGVLTRNKESFDEYHFFGIELDWDKGHATKRTDWKDENKDKAFLSLGIPILRFRMEELYGNKALSEAERNNKIWDNFFIEYFITPIEDPFILKNNELAIKLKENQLTKCRNSKCNHSAQNHNLNGCNYQNTNKASLYCNCTEPFMVSDA